MIHAGWMNLTKERGERKVAKQSNKPQKDKRYWKLLFGNWIAGHNSNTADSINVWYEPTIQN